MGLDGNPFGIEAVDRYSQEAKVYNLTVDNDHTYYVGKGGVLSHNAGGCKPVRWTNNGLDHIFRGDKNGGFHHRAGGINPDNSRVIKITDTVNSGKWRGVYEAVVEICDAGKCFRKTSTFFPDSWSKSRVQMEINAAYINALFNGNKNGLLVGKSSTGFPIEMYVRDGEIVTAYPKL